MKKKSLLALALAAAVSVPSLVQAETLFSIALGPAMVDTRVAKFENGSEYSKNTGFNVLYKFDWKGSRVGLVGTVTHASGSDKVYYEDFAPGLYRDEYRADYDVKYTSVTVGPSYRVNRHLTLYTQFGISHTKMDADEYYLDRSDNTWEHEEKLSGDETGFVYGIGAQVQPWRHWFANMYYQKDEGRTNTETVSVGIGYMF